MKMQDYFNLRRSNPASGRKLRTIVLDSDPPRMCRCLRTLTARGCEVLLVTRPEEMTEAIEAFAPHVVFVAGAVARMVPGDEFTRLRLLLAAESIPVLILPLTGPEQSRQPTRESRRPYVPPANKLRRFADLFAALAIPATAA